MDAGAGLSSPAVSFRLNPLPSRRSHVETIEPCSRSVQTSCLVPVLALATRQEAIALKHLCHVVRRWDKGWFMYLRKT